MSKPWFDMAEEALGPEDTVEKTYPCSLNKQYGYLCLGRKKLVFVSVKGFLRKSYEILLKKPYNEIIEIKLVGRYKFEIVDSSNTYQLETSDISAKIVVEGIEEIVKSSPTKLEIAIIGL
jgi:hypothetical protein